MNASPEEIRVWLVEDNEIYRRGLSRAIDSAHGMSCGGEFECAETALEALSTPATPEVILLDVGLPGMDGLAALEKIRKLSPESRVVILTVFNDSDKIFKAVCSGANGYLLKTASTDAVVTAVRQAAEGGAPMGAEVAERVLTLFAALASGSGAMQRQADVPAVTVQVIEALVILFSVGFALPRRTGRG